MYSLMWKLISLLLGLAAFTFVGVLSVIGGADPLWAVVKAICSFFALWIVFSLMGGIFAKVMPLEGEDALEPADESRPSVQKPSPVSDASLPDLPDVNIGSGLEGK